MILRAFVLWLLCLAGQPALAVPEPAGLGLTAAERSWIERHPLVQVGVSTEFPPYYFAAGQGRYEGFVIDLMQRLAERAGLRLAYRRFERSGDVLAAMRAGEVDVTPFISQSVEREQTLRFVRPLFATQLVLVADRRATDVTEALVADARLAGKRIAVERLSTAAELLQQRYPHAALREFDTSEQALLAVAAGEADVFVGFRQVAVYHMEKHLTANLALRAAFPAAGTTLGPAVRRELPELAAILDKAVATLGTEEIALLAAKWLPRSLLSEAPRAAIDLSAAQRAWIAAHPAPRLGFDASFAPIAFANPAGGFDGLAADITRLLAARSGLMLAYAQGGTFADVYERARRGELDVIVAAARNAERQRHFDFVGPFLRVPTVVVAAAEAGFLHGLDSPGARRLALLREHFLQPQLRSRHPGLVFVERDTQAQVLEALRRGEADLAIGNMKVVNALLEAHHAGALHSVGIVPQGDSELYFAVRKELPELAPILRAALDATAPAEIGALESRWLRTQVEIGVPWARVLAIGAAATALAALVIGALWWSNRRLREAQRTLLRAREESDAQVAARARFSAYLSHELRGALGGLAGGLDLVESGSLPRDSVGRLVTAMRRSAAGLLELCERTLDFERLLQGGADIQPRPTVLLDAIERAIAPWRVQADIKGLTLMLHCTFDDGVRADCDAIRLGQVIQNLVGNAVKFTAQGAVELRAAVDARPRGGHQLIIEVIDSGPGVPAAERERLFSAFTQGDAGRRAGQGAGLGLSIAARIVELMGGTLRLAASSAGGSVFVVNVPIELLPPALDAVAERAGAS